MNDCLVMYTLPLVVSLSVSQSVSVCVDNLCLFICFVCFARAFGLFFMPCVVFFGAFASSTSKIHCGLYGDLNGTKYRRVHI